MASTRRTRAAGGVALGCCVAMWCLAATAFVSSRLPGAADSSRPAANNREAEVFRPFTTETGKSKPSVNWAPAMSLAAAFGIFTVLAVAPVRAEEAAAPAEAAPAPAAAPAEAAPAPAEAAPAPVVDKKAELAVEGEKLKTAPSKADRVKKEMALAQQQSLSADFEASNGAEFGSTKSNKKKSSRPKVEKEKKEEGGGVSVPSFTPAAKAPGAKKVIFSPADEKDPDEISMNAPNPPLLFLTLFGPSFVYLIFYVLGSLDII